MDKMDNALALSEITTTANVELEDIISVFTSRYEDRLHNQLDELRENIKTLSKELSDKIADIKENFDVSVYEIKNKYYSIYAKVDTVTLDGVSVVLSFKNGGYGGGHRIEIPHSKAVAKSIKELNDKLIQKNKEIMEVGKLIANMNRKERQIRAKIVEQKLEASNLKHILENEELLKLIG